LHSSSFAAAVVGAGSCACTVPLGDWLVLDEVDGWLDPELGMVGTVGLAESAPLLHAASSNASPLMSRPVVILVRSMVIASTAPTPLDAVLLKGRAVLTQGCL
jgi:hypothetical protein